MPTALPDMLDFAGRSNCIVFSRRSIEEPLNKRAHFTCTDVCILGAVMAVRRSPSPHTCLTSRSRGGLWQQRVHCLQKYVGCCRVSGVRAVQPGHSCLRRAGMGRRVRGVKHERRPEAMGEQPLEFCSINKRAQPTVAYLHVYTECVLRKCTDVVSLLACSLLRYGRSFAVTQTQREVAVVEGRQRAAAINHGTNLCTHAACPSGILQQAVHLEKPACTIWCNGLHFIVDHGGGTCLHNDVEEG